MPVDFLEKNLEELIIEDYQRVGKRGLGNLYSCNKTQFRLPSGKVIDLISWEIKGNVIYIKIFELKRDVINEAAFWQILEYYCELVELMYDEFSDFVISMNLVGTEIKESAKKILLTDLDVRFFTYHYEYDGLKFKKIGQRLSDIKQSLNNFCEKNKVPHPTYFISDSSFKVAEYFRKKAHGLSETYGKT